jgi:hypothetical protein
VLACVPPTGHHTVGLVTACQSGYYIKHARGNPACCASVCPHPPSRHCALTLTLPFLVRL